MMKIIISCGPAQHSVHGERRHPPGSAAWWFCDTHQASLLDSSTMIFLILSYFKITLSLLNNRQNYFIRGRIFFAVWFSY